MGLYAIILFQLILTGSLIRGIQISLGSRKRITQLEEKKKSEEQRAEELKKREEYVQSEFYLEKVAREELHLAKPGETVVIVPSNQIVSDSAIQQSQSEIKEKPNWQKWWEVVSGKIN